MKTEIVNVSFYGFQQVHELDISFLPAKIRICFYVENQSEMEKIKNRATDRNIIFFSDKENKEAGIMSIFKLDPNDFEVLCIVSELPSFAEKLLIEKCISKNSMLEILDLHSRSSPSKEEMHKKFRLQVFSIYESTEIPAYFTNWAYVNFLVRYIDKNKYNNIHDMFAGSGAIGLSIANELKCNVTLVDANYQAIRSMKNTKSTSNLTNSSII